VEIAEIDERKILNRSLDQPFPKRFSWVFTPNGTIPLGTADPFLP
jgi:hypothetical protein